MAKSPFKTAYNGRNRCAAHIGTSDVVQRHMKDEVDVNNIMRKYQKTGLVNHVNRYQGNYGNFTNMPTFHEAYQKVLDAKEMFLTLPSTIREKFANDPGLFLEYVDDPENAEGMKELGLIPAGGPSPEPAPIKEPEPSPEGDE